MSEILPPAEVSQLEWLYSGAVFKTGVRHRSDLVMALQLSTFAGHLIPIYGKSITCKSLRQALLGCVSFLFPDVRYKEQVADHCRLANQALRSRSHGTWDEGDLFASALLAHLAHSKVNGDAMPAESGVHIEGFMALIRHLQETKFTANLTVHWPMARDFLLDLYYESNMEQYFRLASICRDVIGAPTLQQRMEYLGVEWLALDTTLRINLDMLCMAMRCRFLCNLPVHDPYLVRTLQHVLADTLIIDSKNLREVGAPNPARQCHLLLRYHTSRILFDVLTNPDIQQSFDCPATHQRASVFLNLVSDIVKMHEQWLLTTWTYRRGMGLSLLTLSRETPLELFSLPGGNASIVTASKHSLSSLDRGDTCN